MQDADEHVVKRLKTHAVSESRPSPEVHLADLSQQLLEIVSASGRADDPLEDGSGRAADVLQKLVDAQREALESDQGARCCRPFRFSFPIPRRCAPHPV